MAFHVIPNVIIIIIVKDGTVIMITIFILKANVCQKNGEDLARRTEAFLLCREADIASDFYITASSKFTPKPCALQTHDTFITHV